MTSSVEHGGSLPGRGTSGQAADSAVPFGADQAAMPGDPLAPGGVAPGAGVVLSPADMAPPPIKGSAAKSPAKSEDDDGLFSLEALDPTNLYKKAKAAMGLGPNEEIARQAYRDGMELFGGKRYQEAAKKFSTAAARWPDTALEEDALYMQAECYFFADQYPDAHETYEKLLKKYEYSRYMARAVGREFAIGRFWDEFDEREPHWPITPNFTDKMRPWFDTRGRALKAYEHVRMNDPTGPLADDSLMAGGNAHFLRGDYEEAAHQYDMLRKEYPKSEHHLKASLLAVESKQQTYQGEFYDSTALKEAAEIADHTLMRYGNTLGDERDKVIEARNRVTELRGRQDLRIGRYYDSKRYYAAARIYYQAVLKDYPQTMAAQEAGRRLEEIRDLPDEPPNHFQWLEKLMGTKKRY